MELTRQEFEQILDRKLEEKLEQKLEQKLNQKLANFATKSDLYQALEAQSEDLKNFILVENSHLVSIIQETIVEPMEARFEQMDQRFDRLEHMSTLKWSLRK